MRCDDSVTAKPLHVQPFLTFDFLRCRGADCPVFAPCALQVWDCTFVAEDPVSKLCLGHFNKFQVKKGHNLCLMRVAHRLKPFTA